MSSIFESFGEKNSSLVVVFQSHNNRLFATTPEDFKGTLDYLNSMNYDTIRFNDLNESFYFNGIDNENNTFEKTLTLLGDYCSRYNKVIFMGNCGGAHTAILFGTMLNVDAVIGFNTISYMDQSTLKERGDDRDGLVTFLDQKNPYLNLKNYLDTADYGTQIYTIVSQSEGKHYNQSDYIAKSRNVNMQVVECETELVGYCLLRKGGLITKILSVIDGLKND